MKKFAALFSVVSLGIIAQGCADEAPARDGVAGGPSTDADHPGFKVHPDAVLVGEIDVDAIYDFTVTDTTLRLPRLNHEALIAGIVPGKTILAARGNEDDIKRNPGFIRGVLSMTNEGGDVVLTTASLEPVDIIRGHLDLGGKQRPQFMLPGTRAARAAGGGGAQMQARGDNLGTAVTVNLLDMQTTIPVPGFNLDVAKFPLTAEVKNPDGTVKTAAKNLKVDGSLKATLDADLFLQLGVDGAVDLGWDNNAGFCLNTFFGRTCTGQPVVEGEANIASSYEFKITPTFEFAGQAGVQIPLPELTVDAACVIPPGIPCFIEAGLKGEMGVLASAAAKVTTDRPFRLYGTSRMGGTFGANGVRIKTSGLPTVEWPTGIVPTIPDQDIDLLPLKEAGIPQITIQGQVQASIAYGPVIKFGIGVPKALNAHVEATFKYKVGVEVNVCMNVTPVAFLPTGISAGGHLSAGPQLAVGVGADFGPFHPTASATLIDAYNPLLNFGSPQCGGVPPIDPPTQGSGGGGGGGGGGGI